MLIVESLADHRRSPAYAHDKVVSLGDISIYTDADDKPLPEVLQALKEKTGGAPVDLKALGSDSAVRDFFASVLPDYDRERVYTADIRKLIKWYNQLLEAGVTDFVEERGPEEDGAAPDEAATQESAPAE